MDILFRPLSDWKIWEWETLLGDWVLYLSIGIFVLELIRYVLKDRMNWNLIGDSVTNALTFTAYTFLTYFVYAALYVAVFYAAYELSPLRIKSNWMSIAICVVLSDFVYYWEHRFSHRVNAAWATHMVHHSSPHFNLSVAYRLGPMDDFWPIAFYAPLCLMGFNPYVVFFAAVFVQLYQAVLHTEAIGKLSSAIEAIMNTPSHHRVHHGANRPYLDKNYGGIFIVWDRMFGTFAEEKEPVTYGLVRQIDTVNPVIVFFKGLGDLAGQVFRTPGLGNKLNVLWRPPGWQPPISGKPGQETAGTPESVT